MIRSLFCRGALRRSFFAPAAGIAALLVAPLVACQTADAGGFVRKYDWTAPDRVARWQCAGGDGLHVCDAGDESPCLASATGWEFESTGTPWAMRCEGGDVRFELHAGDRWSLDVARNHPAERVEIAEGIRHDAAADVWYAFAMMVEPGPATTGKWTELGQLRNQPDPGEIAPSPVIAQGFNRGDVFRIDVRSSTEKPLQHNPKPAEIFNDPGFARGRYYSFVYHVHEDPAGAGAADVWINGQQAVAYRGPLGYANRVGPYLKFGIYREPAPEPIAVHYANIEVGGPELAGRIAAPLPTPATAP